MTDKEFHNYICKADLPRNHKIKNSWGVKDSLRVLRKNRWKDVGLLITEHLYYSIIRQVNDYLALELMKGKSVKFPCGMGILELRKTTPKIIKATKKYITTAPIDWGNTMKFWREDEEARLKGIVIRQLVSVIYKVKYNVRHSCFNNKKYYCFLLNRVIKQGLRDNINEGSIDALW